MHKHAVTKGNSSKQSSFTCLLHTPTGQPPCDKHGQSAHTHITFGDTVDGVFADKSETHPTTFWLCLRFYLGRLLPLAPAASKSNPCLLFSFLSPLHFHKLTSQKILLPKAQLTAFRLKSCHHQEGTPHRPTTLNIQDG